MPLVLSQKYSSTSLFSFRQSGGSFADEESSPSFSKSGAVIYLYVPFDETPRVKELGALWEPTRKQWYIEAERIDSSFDRWRQRTLLNAPFAQKDEVKKLGARWDPVNRSWWIFGSIDDNPKFSSWAKNSKLITTQPEDRSESMREEIELKTTKSSSKPLNSRGSIIAELPSSAATSSTNSEESAFANDIAGSDSDDGSSSSSSSSSETFVFFDVETNGLIPKANFPSPKEYPACSDTAKYDTCRIVQFSFLVCLADDLSQILHTGNFIIKSDGFPIDNGEFHGITLDRSLKEGVVFSDMVGEISKYFEEASLLFAHNADFDVNVFKSELFRYGLSSALAAMADAPVFCTMKETKDLVKARDRFDRVKYPKLVELYTFATKKGPEEMVNAHNSLHDVIHLHEAVKALVARGEIKFQPPVE